MNKTIKHVLLKLVITIAFMVLTMLVFHFLPINVTQSMPYGLYLRLPAFYVKEGDYVELNNPMAKGFLGVDRTRGLCKRVDHITEEGLFYVLGEHELSYDSRYFGAVGKEYIEHKLLPVVTFKTLPDWLRKEGMEK